MSNFPDPADVIDFDQLAELRETLGENGFEKILVKFTMEGAHFFDVLEQSNGSDLAAQSHKFAGSAAVFGATELHKALKHLEIATNSKKYLEIDKLKECLPVIWAKTMEVLQR